MPKDITQFYSGLYSEYYDFIYSEKRYSEEAQFVLSECALLGLKSPARLLELACGTGSHAIEFAKRGFEVFGIDSSRDLLEKAKSKSGAGGPRFECADMRNYPYEKLESYQAVICLFDSIGYLLETDAIIETLRALTTKLSAPGLLVLEVWNKAPMLSQFEALRVRRWPTKNGTLLRISETKIDSANSVAEVSYQLLELKNDGQFREHRETQKNRFFSIEEIKQIIETAGFKPRQVYGAYAKKVPSDSDFHLLVFAESKK